MGQGVIGPTGREDRGTQRHSRNLCSPVSDAGRSHHGPAPEPEIPGGGAAGAAKRPPCLFSRSSDPGREEGDIAKSLRAKEKAAGACLTLSRTHGLLCPCDFPGKNTGVGCHFLLQRIFLTQGLNLHLLRWQACSLPLRGFSRAPPLGTSEIYDTPHPLSFF